MAITEDDILDADDDGEIDRSKYNWLGAKFLVNGPDGVYVSTPRWAEALAVAKAKSSEIFARKTKRAGDKTLCVEMQVAAIDQRPDTYISQWWFSKPADFIRVDLTKPDNSYEV